MGSKADGTFALHPDRRAFLRRTGYRYAFPLEEFLSRGVAVMSCCQAQVSPDIEPSNGDTIDMAWHGVFDHWGPRDETRDDNPTTLGAWAWALSRGLDLAERVREIDSSRSLVTGCSRLGKAALVAGARDERFAAVVPNQTGGGGAPLAKRYFGALGEFLSCRAASPAWELHGLPGLPPGDFPAPYDTSRIGPRLGYVRRGGAHGLSALDWHWALDFAERAW